MKDAATTDTFDEVLQKVRSRVPPPRTEAQARALGSLTATSESGSAPNEIPVGTSSAESGSVRRWFKPPVTAPKPRTRKMCFEIEDEIAERFKRLCFLQGAEQRRVVEQLIRGYLATNGQETTAS